MSTKKLNKFYLLTVGTLVTFQLSQQQVLADENTVDNIQEQAGDQSATASTNESPVAGEHPASEASDAGETSQLDANPLTTETSVPTAGPAAEDTPLTLVEEAPIMASGAQANFTVYEDAATGKYVKAEDFNLDTTGATSGNAALKAAFEAANTVEGGAAVMITGKVLLDEAFYIDQNYSNVTGLIGSGPFRSSSTITFKKPQVGTHDPIENLTDNRSESAIVVDNLNGFKLSNFSLERAYATRDFTKDNDFYRDFDDPAGRDTYFGRSNGILVNDSSNVTIDNVQVSKFNRAGIYFGSTKAMAHEEGKPSTSITKKVSNGLLKVTDPSVPINTGNKVINSYSHHNRVAGVLYGYQEGLVLHNNILSYNGHLLDGGTGYGAASEAGTYNNKITYSSNLTNSNYRKGLDIHDANDILIENNESIGDRLHGIEVYNRSHPMTNVVIRNNKVVQNPDFKLENDDTPAYQTNYRAYQGITILTNTFFKKWSEPLEKGYFEITGNTIENLTKPFASSVQTAGIIFRNQELENMYELKITDNAIKGQTADHGVLIINDTGKPIHRGIRGNTGTGAGSGDISIERNSFDIATVTQMPVYIEEKAATATPRGSIKLADNTFNMDRSTSTWRSAIGIDTTNAASVSILNNSFDYAGDTPWAIDRFNRYTPLFSVNSIVPNPAVTIVDNEFTTHAGYTKANDPRYARMFSLWLLGNINNSRNTLVRNNILDGQPLGDINNPLNTRVETARVESTARYIIETRETDEMPVGYRQVVQPGVAGTKVDTYEIIKVGDREISRRLVSSVVENEPTPEVVLIGTGIESTKVEVVTEPIDYDTEIIRDASKPTTYLQETQPGITGEKTKTYTVYLLNDVEKTRTLTTEVENRPAQKRIVVVGTAVERVAYETETQELDFEREVIYDYSQPKGYEKLEQEGSKGTLEKQYKVTYLDDVQVKRELVAENTLKPAQKEIIIKGIGVVVKTEVREVLSVTQFNKITQEDETKPKGYSLLIQEGSPGTLTQTYNVRYEDDVEVERTLISEVEEPKSVDEITLVGTADLSEEFLEEAFAILPKETIEEDPNLMAGEVVVDQPGLEGKLVKLYKVTYLNGVESSREFLGEEIRVQAEERVLRIGTKSTKEIEAEEEVPYKVIYQQTDTLPVGTSQVSQPGKPGVRTIRYEVVYAGAEEVSRSVLLEAVTTDPVDEIILVGTQTTTVTEEEVISDVAYDKTRQEDKTKPIGYSEVIQPGQPGQVVTTYQVTRVNGLVTKREAVATRELTPAKPEITLVGTGVERTLFSQTEEDIAFKQVFQNDATLEVGQTQVKQAGEKGLVRYTYRTEFFNDDQLAHDLVGTELIKPSVDEIILVGTKPLPVYTSDTESIDEEIAYQEIERPDDSRFVGDNYLSQAGVPGTLRKVYRIDYKDGVEIGRHLVSETEVVKPIDQITLIGTKPLPVYHSDTEVVYETIAFKRLEQVDPTLSAGERRLSQAGVDGQVRKTYRVDYKDGVEIDRSLLGAVEEVAVVDEITLVGTKPLVVYTSTTESIDEVVAFNRVEREDPTLSVGERRLSQIGFDGLVRNVYRIDYQDGVEIGRTLISATMLSTPADEITLIGTKPLPVYTSDLDSVDEPIAYIQETRPDASLYIGDSVFAQAGVPGILRRVYRVDYKDGLEINRTLINTIEVQAPVAEVTLVGTKPFPVFTTGEDHVDEVIAFAKEEQEDATLLVGERRLVQAGVAGLLRKVYSVEYKDGIEISRQLVAVLQVTDPLPELTLIGTKPLPVFTTGEDHVDEVIAFAKEEQEDASLPVGERRLVQAGVAGLRRHIYRVDYKDGVEISRHLIDTIEVTAPISELTLVGTKPLPVFTTGEDHVDEMIAFAKEEQEDASLPVGERRLVQAGVAGLLRKVYRVDYKDGVEISRRLIDTIEVTAPISELTLVGTKQVAVHTEEQVLETTLPYRQIETADPSLPLGERRLLQSGREGRVRQIYRVVYENGVEVSRTLISTEILSLAVSEVTLVGIRDLSVVNTPGGVANGLGDSSVTANSEISQSGSPLKNEAAQTVSSSSGRQSLPKTAARQSLWVSLIGWLLSLLTLGLWRRKQD